MAWLHFLCLDHAENGGSGHYGHPRGLSTASSLQRDIERVYGSMSSNPLLRRVYKEQSFEFTQKHRHILRAKVTPAIFGEVIRSIRTDSTLKDPEILKMHSEWLECLGRPHHNFSNLYELDFLLFHLGLIVSPKLLKRLSNTFLNTVFEDEVESPRNGVDEGGAVNDHLVPSFMKTMQVFVCL